MKSSIVPAKSEKKFKVAGREVLLIILNNMTTLAAPARH